MQDIFSAIHLHFFGWLMRQGSIWTWSKSLDLFGMNQFKKSNRASIYPCVSLRQAFVNPRQSLYFTDIWICPSDFFYDYLWVSVCLQVLIVQALRPDRLQSAMSLFASKALGKFYTGENLVVLLNTTQYIEFLIICFSRTLRKRCFTRSLRMTDSHFSKSLPDVPNEFSILLVPAENGKRRN